MATVTPIDTTVVHEQLRGTVDNFSTIEAIYPELSVVLASTIAQHSNADLAGIVERYANKASRARGRSVAGSNSQDEETPEVSLDVDLLAGEKSYPRPNGQDYYTRKWGDHDDVLVVQRARAENQFVLLYGAPGCGKTALVEGAFGDDLYTILGSGDTEVADLVGGYVQTAEGGWVWNDGVLVKSAEEGKVLLIDEIGLIDPKVLSIVYGLMDGRRELNVTANPDRGTIKAKEGFYVIGATNPNAPGVRLSEALLSRFTIQVEMTTDWALAKKLGVPTPMVTASQNLAKKQSSNEVSWSPQFRELLAFRDLEKVFGQKWAIQNLLASAPEIDRPIVADVLSRTYGEAMLPARI